MSKGFRNNLRTTVSSEIEVMTLAKKYLYKNEINQLNSITEINSCGSLYYGQI